MSDPCESRRAITFWRWRKDDDGRRRSPGVLSRRRTLVPICWTLCLVSVVCKWRYHWSLSFIIHHRGYHWGKDRSWSTTTAIWVRNDRRNHWLGYGHSRRHTYGLRHTYSLRHKPGRILLQTWHREWWTRLARRDN